MNNANNLNKSIINATNINDTLKEYNKNRIRFNEDVYKNDNNLLLGTPDLPYLSRKNVFSLISRPGYGNTVFSVQSFMSVSVGRPFILDTYIKPAKENIKVLYLNYDDVKCHIVSLMRSVVKKGNYTKEEEQKLKDNFKIVHVDSNMKDDALLNYVGGILRFYPADIVVFDHLYNCTSTDISKPKPMVSFVNKLRQNIAQKYNVAVYTVHHAARLWMTNLKPYFNYPEIIDPKSARIAWLAYDFALNIFPSQDGDTDTYRLLFWLKGKDYTLAEKDYIHIKRDSIETYNNAYFTETSVITNTSQEQDSRFNVFKSLPISNIAEFNEAIIKYFCLDINSKNLEDKLNKYYYQILASGCVEYYEYEPKNNKYSNKAKKLARNLINYIGASFNKQ